jgi:hypothetical protein
MGFASANRIVQGDEFGAIGEDGLDLHFVDELRHALHYLVLTQPGAEIGTPDDISRRPTGVLGIVFN